MQDKCTVLEACMDEIFIAPFPLAE